MTNLMEKSSKMKIHSEDEVHADWSCSYGYEYRTDDMCSSLKIGVQFLIGCGYVAYLHFSMKSGSDYWYQP